MDLHELHRHWDQFGQDDPLWAILTDASRKGGKWDLEEFFATGREEIGRTIDRLAVLGLPASPGGVPFSQGRALDFGCGVGRLTQALCEHFISAVGVDISESMVGNARRYNRHGSRCDYVHNLRPDLSAFPDASFDFVYSALVLQHMSRELSEGYVREFFRVLRPGGLAVFQVVEPFTMETKPLPRSAYRADIRPVSGLGSLQAGAPALLETEVRNAGSDLWKCPDHWAGRIKLGNHWLDSRGKMIIHDDGRADLTADVHPGEAVRLSLWVAAPKREGTYTLALDMVHEGVCWFAQKGSPEYRMAVRVRGDAATEARESSFEPRIEMHGIPRERVERIISEAGAKLLATDADDSCGPGYTAWVYLVQKAW